MTAQCVDATIITMTVTRVVQKYISEHPSVRDCLKKGLVNYSALSREICRANTGASFDAVLVACRRAAGRLKSDDTHERRIISLVKRARIHIKNKIAVCIAEKPRDLDRIFALQRAVRSARGDFSLVEGEDSITVAIGNEYLAELRELLKGRIIKTSTDLAQISMLFDERIEVTPGVVSYVYGLLAENGINIQEELSCWTELIMILSATDAARTMEILALR